MNGSSVVAVVRRGAHALAVVLVGVAMAPVMAASAQAAAAPCTTTASVSWQTDVPTASVLGAVVDVPGCPDGAHVGLEAITSDDGATETVVGTVADEQVTFDIRAFELGIAPVVGVRILLYGDGAAPVPVDVVPADDAAAGGVLPDAGWWLTPALLLGAVVVTVVGGLLVARARRRVVGAVGR